MMALSSPRDLDGLTIFERKVALILAQINGEAAAHEYVAALRERAREAPVTVGDDALISSYWEGWREGVARRLTAQEA